MIKTVSSGSLWVSQVVHPSFYYLGHVILKTTPDPLRFKHFFQCYDKRLYRNKTVIPKDPTVAGDDFQTSYGVSIR